MKVDAPAGEDLAAVLQALEISEATPTLAGRSPPCSGGRGAMKSEETARLKALEAGNRRPKQSVADRALDIRMLKYLSEGNW